MEVHTILGPGLTEVIYEAALIEELTRRRFRFQRQVEVPVVYKHTRVGTFRLDLVVEDVLVLELKAVDAIDQAHRAQLLTYLRAGKYPLGLVINFNATHLRGGLSRVVY